MADFERQLKALFEAGTRLPMTILWRGQAAGKISLRNLDDVNGSCELAYWLATHARGRGVMTRAVRELLSYGFQELAVRRGYLYADINNRGSCGVAERLGMRREGVLREAVVDHRGGFRDLVVYAVLKDEWMDRATKPVV